ncbi:MAG: NADP-dependent isocitrate dehydrogenase, partial [Brevibacterium aurantiacum]|nr:NADP-dependent isocitrate dehydrogenase [Brevibacterium aurantiacum]
MAKIIYTRTDEAPLLATYSLKPIIEAFATSAGVEVETRDISLAARVLAQFADRLPADQQVPDSLSELGDLAQTPEANIIKLPNISASVPQLKATIAELQSQGYELPDYPDEPSTDEERDAKARYDKVKGSAVNPVLREGNSEKSVVIPADDTLQIRLRPASGETVVLKESLPVLADEVIDATKMDVAELHKFLTAQIVRAKEEGILFSVHLKATMMKVSDPILSGHVIEAFFPEVYAEYGVALAEAGLTSDNGLAAILGGLDALPANVAKGVKDGIEKGIAEGPSLAMVNSDKGITNLHVPSDVIVDASMPAMIRVGGKMWNKDDATQDALAVIPDSSYAGVYQTVIEDCRA